MGGLFNLVLVGDLATRAIGLGLYVFLIWAYWRTGVRQAALCMDAEAVRARRLRVADGATLTLIYAFGGRGIAAAGGGPTAAPGERLIGPMRRRRAARGPVAARSGLAQPGISPGGGGRSGFRARASSVLRWSRSAWDFTLGGLVSLAAGGRGSVSLDRFALLEGATFAVVSGLVLCEELVFRGVLQRGVESELGAGNRRSETFVRLAAAAASTVVAVIAGRLAGTAQNGALGLLAPVAGHGAASLAFAFSGRVSAAWLARLAGTLVGLWA